VAPTGSCAVLCQLLIWAVGPQCKAIGSSASLVQRGMGTCLLLLPFSCRSCRAKGHSLGWQDARGVGRSGKTGAQVLQEPASLARSGGLCLEGSPDSGPQDSAYAISIPYPSCRACPGPGRGRRERLVSHGMLRGSRCNLSPLPSLLQARVLQPQQPARDRQREGSRQSQGPLHRPPRLFALPASPPYAMQPPSPRAALDPPRSLPHPPELLWRRPAEWYGSLPGTHPSLHRTPREEARGAVPRVAPHFSPLLPPIQTHTNHVIVLCFHRQFLDSDMPRYYLFPLFFFPSPLPLSLLSPPSPRRALSRRRQHLDIQPPLPPHAPSLLPPALAPLTHSASFAVCLGRALAGCRSPSHACVPIA